MSQWVLAANSAYWSSFELSASASPTCVVDQCRQLLPLQAPSGAVSKATHRIKICQVQLRADTAALLGCVAGVKVSLGSLTL